MVIYNILSSILTYGLLIALCLILIVRIFNICHLEKWLCILWTILRLFIIVVTSASLLVGLIVHIEILSLLVKLVLLLMVILDFITDIRDKKNK